MNAKHVKPDAVNLETLEVSNVTSVAEREIISFVKGHGCIETAWDQCERADWMLWMLQGALKFELVFSRLDTELRTFACWCARRSLEINKCHESAIRVVEAFEQYVKGEIDSEKLTRAQENARVGATDAAVVGLPKRLLGAAAQLACFHCGDQNPMHAAVWSAGFHVRALADAVTHELNGKNDARNTGWPDDAAAVFPPGHPARNACVAAMQMSAMLLEAESRQRFSQANKLRSIAGNPFAGVISNRRWPRDELGMPLLPDIAENLAGELRKYPVSEAQRQQHRPVRIDPQKVQGVVVRLMHHFEPLKQDNEAAAYKHFLAYLDSILEAVDFDAAEDGPFIEAYGIVREHLFGDCWGGA